MNGSYISVAVDQSGVLRSLKEVYTESDFNVGFVDLAVNEIFERAFEGGEFDVAELSLTRTLISLDRGDCPYQPLPIFPHRSFRHRCLYVAANGPSDVDALRGTRIGIERPNQTAVMTLRGVLQDQYDIGTDDAEWIVGAIEEPLSNTHRASRQTPTLSDRLISSDIKALISLRAPRAVETGKIRPLFENPQAEEDAFLSKFQFVPIMHVIGLHHRVFADDPIQRKHLIKDLIYNFERAFGRSGAAETDLEVSTNQLALGKAAQWAFDQGLIRGPLDLRAIIASGVEGL